MDFMRDTLADGRAFRALTLIDTYTRESPVIEADVSPGAVRAVAVLGRSRATRGLPQQTTADSGPEFQSKAFDARAHRNHVHLVSSRPRKPADNTFIRAFNGRVRDECLNQHWFLSLANAQHTTEHWRESYNTAQPHSALGGRTPSEYATALLHSGHTKQVPSISLHTTPYRPPQTSRGRSTVPLYSFDSRKRPRHMTSEQPQEIDSGDLVNQTKGHQQTHVLCGIVPSDRLHRRSPLRCLER